jgi:hypothetical protein
LQDVDQPPEVRFLKRLEILHSTPRRWLVAGATGTGLDPHKPGHGEFDAAQDDSVAIGENAKSVIST